VQWRQPVRLPDPGRILRLHAGVRVLELVSCELRVPGRILLAWPSRHERHAIGWQRLRRLQRPGRLRVLGGDGVLPVDGGGLAHPRSARADEASPHALASYASASGPATPPSPSR